MPVGDDPSGLYPISGRIGAGWGLWGRVGWALRGGHLVVGVGRRTSSLQLPKHMQTCTCNKSILSTSNPPAVLDPDVGFVSDVAYFEPLITHLQASRWTAATPLLYAAAKPSHNAHALCCSPVSRAAG